jgi:hypothetical protein
MNATGNLALKVLGWILAALVTVGLFFCADRLGAHGHHSLESVLRFLAFLISPL